MGCVTIKAVVNEERDIEKVWYDNNEKGESLQVIGNDLTYEKVIISKHKIRVRRGHAVPLYYAKEVTENSLKISEKTAEEFKHRFELPRKYIIKVVVDSDNDVLESKRENNVYEKTVMVCQKPQIPGGG